MDFAHSPLRSDGIRLLLPTGTSPQNLYFRVQEFCRENAPPYTAVSYTWGDERATKVIYLNGKVFRVRPNLWSCLYYLSLHAKHQPWDYIWADAICIDQTNNPERNVQVRFMDATYRHATCVSVWLGLMPFPQDLHLVNEGGSIMTFDDEGFDWTDAMDDVANRPYWSRFWVIQEFLLGQNVELYCSGSRIDWLYFQEVLGRTAGMEMEILDSTSYGAISNGPAPLHAALPLVMGRHPDRHPEFLQPLHDLLVSHRRSQCKDPRDRVFALLGLVTPDERAFLERYFPDYTLSEDSVITITLGHLMDINLQHITTDSEQIFLGLGVESRTRRSKLLRRAERFDYVGGDGNTTYLQMMEAEAEWESIEDEDTHETVEFGTWQALGNCGSRFGGTIAGFILVTLVVALLRYFGLN